MNSNTLPLNVTTTGADGKPTDSASAGRARRENRAESQPATPFTAENNNRDNALSATDFGPYSLRRRE